VPLPSRRFECTAGLLALALSLGGCGIAGELRGQGPKPLPQPPGIMVAFNQREGASYRSPISGQRRNGDDLEALLLATIRGARREILVAVQELSLPEVARALAEQHRRGLRVRVVLENSYSTPWSDQHEAELNPHLRLRRRQLLQLAARNHDGLLSPAEREAGDAVLILQRAGVPVIDDWNVLRDLIRGGEIDEAPQAYRRLPDVLAEHAGTIRVLHTLRPFAVAMAGAGEFDPYKD